MGTQNLNDIEDHFRFESMDHGKSVLAGLQNLRQMQQLFDVVLVAESREFPAHRVVLASCSDYFRAMFTDGLRECSESRINLNGLTASSIAHLIDFAYNSTINIDSDNCVDVLSGATHIQILPVIKACENYLREHLTIDNCMNTSEVAELFSLINLQEHVISFVSRNWSTFSMSVEFHQLQPHFLITVLSSGYPVHCKEVDVLMAILSWFSFSPSERAKHMEKILNCVLFENIAPHDFLQALTSKEWAEFNDTCPSIVECFPALVELCNQSMNLHCLEEVDRVISVTDYCKNNRSVMSVTRIEVRPSFPKAQNSSHYQGLLNMRGFHSTIIVAGGFRKESGMTNNVLYLDSGSGTLKHLTKIPHLDQINFGVAVLHNQLYVAGGCFNDHMQEIAHPFGFRYTPTSDKWVSIAPMQQERCRFLLCATEEKLFAIGGDPFASDVGPEDVSPCEMYNPKTNKWKYIAPLPGNRSQLAGTGLWNSVFISGGIQENEELVFRDFYKYDQHEDSWEKKADMLTPRADHSMFVWEGKVHVIGGWHLDPLTNHRVMVTSIECYNSDSDSWEVIGHLNVLRTYGTYTLDGNCIYAIGGWSDRNHLQKCQTIDVFDLHRRAWVQGHEQKIALWEHCACALYLPKYAPSS